MSPCLWDLVGELLFFQDIHMFAVLTLAISTMSLIFPEIPAFVSESFHLGRSFAF